MAGLWLSKSTADLVRINFSKLALMVLWPMLDIPIEAFLAVRAITWTSSELADSKIPVFLSILEAKVKAYSNKGGHVRAHGFSMPSVLLFHTSSSSAGEITTACCWSAPMPSFQSETQTVSSVFRRSKNRRSDLSIAGKIACCRAYLSLIGWQQIVAGGYHSPFSFCVSCTKT